MLIIKLVKMWASKTPDVVVRTLKISLNGLFFWEGGEGGEGANGV